MSHAHTCRICAKLIKCDMRHYGLNFFPPVFHDWCRDVHKKRKPRKEGVSTVRGDDGILQRDVQAVKPLFAPPQKV